MADPEQRQRSPRLGHATVTLLLSLWLVACAHAPAPAVPEPVAPAPVVVASVVPAEPAPAASPETEAAAEAAAASSFDRSAPRMRLDPADDATRANLWQRVRDGFAMPPLEGDIVRKWEQYYSTRADYLKRMTDRGARYLFHIVEDLQRREMPMELALLPFVESAFDPQAMSRARASGMWQFMPATGKDFELRQNVFRDDRRDVLASTRAALDYLGRLHKRFGDWQLALAAYNWGQGNVQRAIASNARAGKPTDYASLAMPDETRNYVPKLQAMKNLIARPDVFGVSLSALGNHPYFVLVAIEHDIDVALVARLAGLDLEAFQQLNPQLNKPVILAAGTPQVLLPYDNANRFLQALQHPHTTLATWTAWVAPRTLKPSEAARHVGMAEEQLREVNRIPERMLVKAGSTLLVPRNSRLQADVASHVADNATMTLTPEARPVRRVAYRAGRKGESVVSVANLYGVSPAALAAWNKVPVAGQFKAGQQVVVMLPVVARRGVVGKAARGVDRKTVAKAGASTVASEKIKLPAKSKGAVTVAAKRELPAKARQRSSAKLRSAPSRA